MRDKDSIRPHLLGFIAIVLTYCAIVIYPTTDISVVEVSAHFFSGLGNTVFLCAGFLALVIRGVIDREGRDVRLALLVCGVVTIAVQSTKLLSATSLVRPSGGLGGYPSGHAAASFALAFLLSCRFPWLISVWYTVAACITWSRIPVGAHYPYQVYAGSVLGILVAVLLYEMVYPNKVLQRLAYRGQVAAVAIVPLVALFNTAHECENHLILIGFGGTLFVWGVALRVWCRQHELAAKTNSDRYPATGPYALVRYPAQLANTVICAGVSIASETVWLLPLSLMSCIVIYGLAVKEEERRSPITCIHVPKRPLRWRFRHSAFSHADCLLPAIRCEMITALLGIPVVLKEFLSNAMLWK
jgi:membrane-associated phospholipid phosphatase